MDFGHFQQREIEVDEQDHVGINDLHTALALGEHKFLPFDIPLYLCLSEPPLQMGLQGV